MFKSARVKFALCLIFMIIGVLLLSEFFAPIIENVKQDAWIKEDPS